MVGTRSTRASARLRKQKNTCLVDDNMEESVDNRDEQEEEEMVEESNVGDDEVEENEPEKNDIGCKSCLHDGEPSSKKISKQESQVRFNDVVETHEVETEYDKPNRTMRYLQGFAKRVVLCTVLVMIGKYAWPRLQPIVWPEEPIKVNMVATTLISLSIITM